VLPARQRAVLILREVLSYSAREVAGMLDTTIESINSALKRARAALHRHQLDGDSAPLTPNSRAEQALVIKFVDGYQSGDVDALIDLLTADVRLSMPPIPLEYHGRDAFGRFYTNIFRHRTYALVPTRANGQPAFGAYLHTETGSIRRASGLLVLSVSGDRICGLTRFDNDVLPWFGLPRMLRG
jgi:hypothetical protein